jgi:hypothetical protein
MSLAQAIDKTQRCSDDFGGSFDTLTEYLPADWVERSLSKVTSRFLFESAITASALCRLGELTTSASGVSHLMRNASDDASRLPLSIRYGR